MKKIALSVLLLMTFVGCRPVVGILELYQSITLNGIEEGSSDNEDCWDEIFDDCEEVDPVIISVPLAQGRYNAKLYADDDQLTLTLETLNSREQTFLFAIPEGVTIPSYEGEVDLTAAQSGQPVDLHASIYTEEWSSEIERGFESCTYTRQRRVCRRVGNGRRDCRWETEVVYGRQEVEYHYDYSKKYVTLLLSEPNTPTAEVGSFDGTLTESTKVYDYKGPCY